MTGGPKQQLAVTVLNSQLLRLVAYGNLQVTVVCLAMPDINPVGQGVGCIAHLIANPNGIARHLLIGQLAALGIHHRRQQQTQL